MNYYLSQVANEGWTFDELREKLGIESTLRYWMGLFQSSGRSSKGLVCLAHSSANRILMILWIMKGKCWSFPPIFCGVVVGAVESSCGWHWTAQAAHPVRQTSRCGASAYGTMRSQTGIGPNSSAS